jgi:hypothetical protein
MSEQLDREMEELDELEEADASTAKKDDHGPAVTKPTDGKKDLAKGAPKATAPKTKPSDASSSPGSAPKLKSEMVQGLADHIKGLKKEELEALYQNTLVEEEEEEEESDDDEEDEAGIPKGKKKNGNGDAPAPKEESKKVKESIEDRVDLIDVSDDVTALVDGEELSEEFKNKAATIFESAVKTKVRSELERIQEQNDVIMEDLAENTMGDLVEKVDDYMNYVVEQWMEDNQLAIERGLKGEIAEDFIGGMKQLFEDHYIDVPDEKYDILESNLSRIEELENKLNKQMEENVQLKKQKGELVKESLVADIADGMTDTETEKFQSLVEDVEFSDEESYKGKLQTIRESYFGSGEVENQQVLTEEGSENETQEDVSDSMARYMTAISQDNTRAKK